MANGRFGFDHMQRCDYVEHMQGTELIVYKHLNGASFISRPVTIIVVAVWRKTPHIVLETCFMVFVICNCVLQYAFFLFLWLSVDGL